MLYDNIILSLMYPTEGNHLSEATLRRLPPVIQSHDVKR